MIRRGWILALLLWVGVSSNPSLAAETALTPEQQTYILKLKKIAAEQTPIFGDILLPDAHATLHLGKNYYFLGPEDARKVLVDAWGNPPQMADDVLGLVFPAGESFASADSWGAVVTFEKTGYVSDEDAQTADYAALLEDMRKGQDDSNAKRKEQGYPAINLVGWAQQPTYDAQTHSVIWARNLEFADATENTLNYDVRLLGRYGVLSMNMVSTMKHLDDVKGAATAFGKSASFDDGARYADFVPDVDEKAGYGIAGLVAAGVGVAAAKKLGLLAVVLGFGKKFIVLLVAGLAAARKRIARIFGWAKDDEIEDEWEAGAEVTHGTSSETETDTIVTEGESTKE